MGLLNAIGLGTKAKPIITKAPVSQGWFRSIFTSMNATDDCVVLMGGKKVVHKVPQFFWINNAIQWAYSQNRVAKTGIMGALEKAGVFGAKIGFKFLQMPLIKSVSPLMQGNLLFSLVGATLTSGFRLATGNVTGAIHNAIGAGAAIAGTAALAKYIPLALGMNPLTGWAAAIGFGITMFVEPKIRKMMGLDRESNQIPAMDPAMVMQQMQQMGQSPYQTSALQGLQALSGGAQAMPAQQVASPYGYYGYPASGYTGYGVQPQPAYAAPMSGYGYPYSFGANPQLAAYYQQQQLEQQRADMDAQRVLSDVTSRFRGLAHDSTDPNLRAAGRKVQAADLIQRNQGFV